MAKHPYKIRSCWFRRVANFEVLRTKSGEAKMHVIRNVGAHPKYCDLNSVVISDTEVMNAFIWIGRYLAEKGKLPRHLALEEIAVGAQRTSKAIRTVIATEHYQLEVLRNDQEQK